jgi:alpha-tubulin suppressor-like RCC1 family protein
MKRALQVSVLYLVTFGLASCGGGGSGDNGGSMARPVATVIVSPAELTLTSGQTQQLTATTQDANGNVLTGRSIAWSTSDAAIATVSGSGLVTAFAAGAATITATAEGQTDTAAVTVGAATPVATVTVLPANFTIPIGATYQLAATAQDANGNVLTGRSIAWSTSDAAIATVSASGLVTAFAAGAATITATSEGQNGGASLTVVVASTTTYESVATGGAHTCALTPDGSAYCWGRGESGQLGVAPPATTCPLDGGPRACSLVPVAVSGGLAFEQLAGGGAHTCGLTSDGTAYCWGRNTSGQLGDNSTTLRTAPVPVVTTLKFAVLDAGGSHTCALTSTGVGYCWGLNDRGQLGDGTTTNRSAPVAVTGGHIFESIVAGGFETDFDSGHTCAVVSNGVAYCWGHNERGQLGIGSGGLGSEDLTPHPVPTLVTGSHVFDVVTAGLGRHTCGLTDAGAAYCWGENTFGALGNGLQIDSNLPVAVSGGLAFEQLIAGGFIGHTCALTASDDAYCWGENERGQVGDGTAVDRLTPVAVAGDHSFTSIDAGFRHTCGLVATGNLYCWGSGAAGQLGNNSTSQSNVPVEVAGNPWDYARATTR